MNYHSHSLFCQLLSQDLAAKVEFGNYGILNLNVAN